MKLNRLPIVFLLLLALTLNVSAATNNFGTINPEKVDGAPLLTYETGDHLQGRNFLIYSGELLIERNSTIVLLVNGSREINAKTYSDIRGFYYFAPVLDQAGTWEIVKINGKDAKGLLPAIEVVEKPEDIKKEPVIPPARTVQVNRYSGSDRYQTALSLAKFYKNKPEKVVIASGQIFADALFAGPLASYFNSPMYLSPKASLPVNLLDELKAQEAKVAYLVGGEAALSKSIEEELVAGGIEIVRLAGINRYETAEKVANYINELKGVEDVPTRVIASAQSFPDALAAVPYANGLARTKPIIFSPIVANDSIVIGGTSQIPSLEGETRVAGDNRYTTSIEIAKKYSSLEGPIERVVIVSGENYPDSLAAGPWTDLVKGPILLTGAKKLDPAVASYLKGLTNLKTIDIVGGVNTISPEVEKELVDIFK